MTSKEVDALKWAAHQPQGAPLGPWAVRWNAFEKSVDVVNDLNKESKK